jgi:hypothetical protein
MTRPLWRCPECGQTFVSPNMPHSCVIVPLAAHFDGRPELLAVYERLLGVLRERGPVTENVTKSRISFQTRMRFAGIERPRRDHIVATFVLTRPVASERVWKIEPLAPYYYVHRVRLHAPEDVDAELMAWLDEARQVGDQRHLEPGWEKVPVGSGPASDKE